ncbi:MAG: hypothetical protein BWY77_01613 [bacterium ADurb.Bin431]|nr:MAG: hypothetical protein BWY77_01613 [bacterium ADurb.Bin431]
MLAMVAEILAHRRARIGGDVLHRGRGIGGGSDDNRVLHGAVILEGLDHLRHGRGLLADGNIDADDVGILLVDKGVHYQGGLADLAVADDQLALAAADGDHRVDRLDARLQRLLHRLALGHTQGLAFDGAEILGVDRPLAVHRLAEGVDHPAQQLRPDRHFHHPAGALGNIPLLDEIVVAEKHAADIVLFKVQGHAIDAVGKLDQLHGHDILKPIDAGDAVANLQNLTHLLDVDLLLELFDLLFKNRGNLFGSDFHGCNLLYEI